MYARVQTFDLAAIAASEEIHPQEIMDATADNPGFRGGWALPSAVHPVGTVVTLWDTAEDAERSTERTAEKVGRRGAEPVRDEIGRVIEDLEGPSAHTAPACARVVWMDEPRRDDVVALIDRGSRERISPVVTSTDGTVRLVVVRLDGNRTVSLELAENALALAYSLRAMMRTELLPFEDPALLTGPTSSDACAVLVSA